MTTMTPSRYRVVERTPETGDTVTLALEPVDEPLPVFSARPVRDAVRVRGGGGADLRLRPARRRRPVAHGTGGRLSTSGALCRAEPGCMLGVRGPFGRAWDLPEPAAPTWSSSPVGSASAPLRPWRATPSPTGPATAAWRC